MIAYISGQVLFRASRYILVDVSGVGYKLNISLETLGTLKPEKGKRVELFTHLYVRENALDLYGFATMAELEFFELLIGISGIGPKSAINVLSLAPLDSLKRAISSGDTVSLTKVSGIGKRIAEKIILELRDKLGRGESSPVGEDEEQVIDALVSLGYTAKEARDALRKISDKSLTLNLRIKAALKILGTSK